MKSFTRFAVWSGIATLLMAGHTASTVQAQVGLGMNVGNAGYTSTIGQLPYASAPYVSYYPPYGYRSYGTGISYRSASYGYPVYSGTRVAISGYGVPSYAVSNYGVATYGGIYRRPTYYVAPRTSYYGFSRIRPSLAPPTFVRPRRRF